MAYPAIAQDENMPVHVPIAIGSAVWNTCVTCCTAGYSERSVRFDPLGFRNRVSEWGWGLTLEGRCRRRAAMRSPGASKVTVGMPKVTPRREARAPPETSSSG